MPIWRMKDFSWDEEVLVGVVRAVPLNAASALEARGASSGKAVFPFAPRAIAQRAAALL